MTDPRVSVIIPVRNGAETIRTQLDALRRQETDITWELIVANNGSTDDTVAVVLDVLGSFPDGRLVDASDRRGGAHAKNRAAEFALGDILLFCDADDEVDETWLSTLADGVERYGFAGGPIDRRRFTDSRPGELRVPITTALHLTADGKPFAVGANLGMTKALFQRLGGFDTDFVGGNEDADIALRAAAVGSPPVFVPGAVVHYRDRNSWLGRFRQYRAYGETEPLLYSRHRSTLSPRGPRKAARYWIRVGLLAVSSWRGRERRILVVRLAGRGIGRVIGSIKHRVVFL